MKRIWAVLALLGLMVFFWLGAMNTIIAEENQPIVIKGDANYRGVYHGFEIRLVSAADKYIYDPEWKDKERHVWEVTFGIRALTDEAKASLGKIHHGGVFYRGVGMKTAESPNCYEMYSGSGKAGLLMTSQFIKLPKSFKNAMNANVVVGYRMGFPVTSSYKAEDLRWNLQNVAPNARLSKEVMGWKVTYLGVSRLYKLNETIHAAVSFKVERTTSKMKENPGFDLQNIRNDLKREFQYHTSSIRDDATQNGAYIYQYEFKVKEEDLATQRKWTLLLVGIEPDPQWVHFEFTLP